MSRLSNRPDKTPNTPLKGRKSTLAGTPDSRLSLALKSRTVPASNQESNIRVYVRCRGRNDREIAENSAVVVSTTGNNGDHRNKLISVQTGSNAYTNKAYTFDQVFGPESDQNMVYDEVAKGILHEVISGYNCTIFAYGQTGTGKTYTMSGDLNSNQGRPVDKSGIIPRILYNLFKQLDTNKSEFSCKVSYIELYNEELRDLIAVDDDRQMKIYDDSSKRGTVIQGMEEAYIRNAEEGIQVLRNGSYKRHVAATKCNDLSSRSHSVFTITLNIKEVSPGGDECVRIGKLNLVDLAGSENINRSGAENKRAREAGMINQSLLTLGRVINGLVEKSLHIPYRESKLTRLLQDSLGGRTKTCIIATVSPAKVSMDETISTLEYASRAKNIKNKPQVNQTLSKQVHLMEYVTEIDRLRSDLEATRQKNGVYLTQESYQALVDENESRRVQIEDQQSRLAVVELQLSTSRERQETFDKEFKQLKDQLVDKEDQLHRTQMELAENQTHLKKIETSLNEETQVRKAHQQTEARLLAVGKELINSIGSTTSDIKLLHNRIEEFKSVNYANKENLSTAKLHVNSSFNEYDKRAAVFHNELRSIERTLEQSFGNFSRSGKQNLETLRKSVDSSLELYSELHSSLSEKCMSGHNALNDALYQLSPVKDIISSQIGEQLSQLRVMLQTYSRTTLNEIQKHQEDIRGSFNSIGKEFKSTFDKMKCQLVSQRQEISQLRAHINTMAEEASNNFDEQGTLIRLFIEEQQDQASKEKQRIIEGMTSVILTLNEERTALLAQQFNSLRSQLGSSKQQFDTSLQQISKHIEMFEGDQESLMSTLSQDKTKAKSSLMQIYDRADKNSESLQELSARGSTQILQAMDSRISAVKDSLAAIDSFSSNVSTVSEETHRNLTCLIDSLPILNQQTDKNLSMNLKVMDDNHADKLSDLNRVVNQLKVVSHKYEETNKENILNLKQQVNGLEAIPDIPNSNVPPKQKEYTYTVSLPRTLSRAEILERLRQERDGSVHSMDNDIDSCDTSSTLSDATTNISEDSLKVRNRLGLSEVSSFLREKAITQNHSGDLTIVMNDLAEE